MQSLERESQIKALGSEITKEMEAAVQTGACYFLHRGHADAARIRMELLIKERPASYVQALEVERGLA